MQNKNYNFRELKSYLTFKKRVRNVNYTGYNFLKNYNFGKRIMKMGSSGMGGTLVGGFLLVGTCIGIDYCDKAHSNSTNKINYQYNICLDTAKTNSINSDTTKHIKSIDDTIK